MKTGRIFLLRNDYSVCQVDDSFDNVLLRTNVKVKNGRTTAFGEMLNLDVLSQRGQGSRRDGEIQITEEPNQVSPILGSTR